MTKTIVVDIDCGEDTCDMCPFLDSEYNDYCTAFGFTKLKGMGEYVGGIASAPYKRLSVCRVAEVTR